jgi:hypothetical protein
MLNFVRGKQQQSEKGMNRMLYIVRGKNHQQERTLRVHAESPAEAEKIGWKRGLFVTEVTTVESTTKIGFIDRVADLAWKAWQHKPGNPLKAWGRAVPTGQAAFLVLLGGITWVMDLRALGFI